MNTTKSTVNHPKGYRAIGLLAIVLLALFWRSLLPDYVHFSNDAPLGQHNTEWVQMPAGITGMWGDLNYTGFNTGTFTLTVTTLLVSVLSPVAFAKFYPAITLLLLGLSAWTLCRQLKLSPLAAMLAALAAMLNSTYFSTACWGVASQEIAAAMDFFALALILGCQAGMPRLLRWSRLALAGLCVGMNVMEAADIGALYSILVGLFVIFHALVEGQGPLIIRLFRGISRAAVVAVFAVFIALQAVFSLVGIGITGVAGAAQDAQTKAAHWDWATQWSLPKVETLGLMVPGVFGYKMDTPKDMMPALQEAYQGGVYWGGAGRDPAIDRYFDAGGQENPPPGFMRFSGGGNYCGILVLLIAGWAIAQSLRRKNSPFTEVQKRIVQFWALTLLLCLLFAWGRFAPFYALLYKLPYFSTIRNPAKFLNFFGLALVIVFAFGVNALSRRYLDGAAGKASGLATQWSNWWARAGAFDRKWTFASVGLFAASVLGWLVYSSEKPAMIQYLKKVGFPDDRSAAALVDFSLGQVVWFLALLAIGVGLLLVLLTGYFNGPRARMGALLLGGFMLFDLGRSDLPWVIHWDYKQKYEVGTLNPVLELLRNKPYEHRVTGLPSAPQGLELLNEVYRIEWMQHHFPYYNIQSLDIVQMPRMPEDMKAFKEALAPRGDLATAPLMAREWQLTSTRYVLGPAGFLDALNQQLDPVQQRFQFALRFNILPKPGVPIPGGVTPEQYAHYLPLEKLTAVTAPEGPYALFEFTGALPRAKLYANWQVNTNDSANLKSLGDLNFDPAKTVLVSTPAPTLPPLATNDNAGSVGYESYRSKHIVLNARAAAPSVLLLNDKFDPHWTVTVDGQPAQLLRCNYFMRGVYLPAAGQHKVEFSFSLPNQWLYTSLSAVGLGFVLCAVIFWLGRRAGPGPVQP